MSIEPRNILETYFETGDIPTQEQFKDFLDSYVHQLDDGITVYPVPGTTIKYFGIGTENPESRLGLKSLNNPYQSIISFCNAEADFANWFISMNPTDEDRPGFSIDEVTPDGTMSRFFIEEGSGNVGLGTVIPTQRLDIQQSTPSGIAGIKLVNTANIVSNGWLIGQAQNSSNGEDGSLSIFENTVSANTEYFKILSGGKVGIGVAKPDIKLHVSLPVELPDTDIDLREGTGIFMVGPDTNNVVVDYRGFQARKGQFIGDPTDPTPSLEITADVLNFQRVGGAILIHGDDDIAVSKKGIITEDGFLGLGVLEPAQRIDIDGAIKVGDTTANVNGSIRYNGDFQGYKNGAWVSLTAASTSANLWTQGTENTIYYNNGTLPRVAIGATTANGTLHVQDSEQGSGPSAAAIINTSAVTTSTNMDDIRVGLKLKNAGAWGGSADSKDIALYVQQVNGLTAKQNNIAAVLNGNVCIGDLISGQGIIGSGGKNVLAMQAGNDPSVSPNTNTVQMYATNSLGTAATLDIMMGNGDVISLSKQAALTAKDDTAITDVYNTTVMNVINNMRTRINELEARLEALGVIA